MAAITRHPEKGKLAFLRRTIAAQTHLLGCLAAIFGAAVLIARCSRHQMTNHILASWIFGVSSVFLFATSSLYHFLYDGFCISEAWEAKFESLDHIAIYFFIAGTYTVFLMNAIANPWANRLLVLVWCVALLGISYSVLRSRLPTWAQHRFVYTGFFLAMGWLFVLRLGEIAHGLSGRAFIYFVLAGLSYTVGAIVYATKRPNLFKNVFGFHELWHVLVVFGYGFHYLLILSFY